ncbi:dirigent protein 5-like [Oryza brachyantha]|uniref:dirigent protein 5-like n=1 Tax=Oryza brachyantha TaxID=4533 RepID=UPI001ADB6446|nr:dirigent protein 5-like [Oryza brachyantha]
MATWSKASLIIAAIFLLSLSCSASGVAHGRRSSSSSRRLVRSYDEPCKKMRLYLHDILYDYSNSTANSTAAAATKPTALSTAVSKSGYFFGRVVVFNDPVTEGKALEETAVRAQGLYFYDRKDAPNAWLAFSIVFNSTAQQGTLNLMGAVINFNLGMFFTTSPKKNDAIPAVTMPVPDYQPQEQ